MSVIYMGHKVKKMPRKQFMQCQHGAHCIL